MYNPYAPMQQRYDTLMQQKNMIDNQLQQLQSYNQIPNVTINNGMPTQCDYDFNGRYVSSIDEARNLIADNKPILAIDRNEPFVYMNTNGNIVKYRLEEVLEESSTNNIDERLNALESKFDTLLETLNKPKRGNKNEQVVQSNEESK